jgi:3-oxoacyl-[acyl-carrier protein] reductase
VFSGQKFLITGANGGIGIELTKVFLKNNAKLILFYNENRDQIDNLLTKYPDYASSVEIYQINLLDEKNLQNLLKQITDSGYVDGFIHSVTLPTQNKTCLQLNWDDYQSNIDLQTKSFFQIVKSIVPSMKERKYGRIVNILTSYVVGRPPNNQSSYTVSKYSLLGLSKSLSVELGPYGITVNSVSPSMTNTNLIEKLPSKLKEIIGNNTPVGRLAEPNEITSSILFLCSKNSSYVSGENILISAGETMH